MSVTSGTYAACRGARAPRVAATARQSHAVAADVAGRRRRLHRADPARHGQSTALLYKHNVTGNR